MRCRLIPLLLFFFACQKTTPQSEPVPEYEGTPVSTALSGRPLEEVSGISDSRSRPGFLWTQQDSGHPPILFLVGRDGSVKDSVVITDAVNRDWEDMALATLPEEQSPHLFIADIGDNNAIHDTYTIYRFVEPPAGVEAVSDAGRIVFAYPDGAHDAEAFLVDEISGDIFLITKREEQSRLYRLPYPQSLTEMNQAVPAGTLPYTGVVSASMSTDGKEILIKTYTQVFHYERKNNAAIPEVLSVSPKQLGYQLEAQGEAIGFAADGSGFFTLSEEALGVKPRLNFYRKK